ncbi:MAG: DEAD/DEAH box helicase family protein [Candidatus Faecivicinus sp.]
MNRLRCRILEDCMDSGSGQKGIYTLNVPTGGGKTVASLAFALRHAVENNMGRIIYVIPCTSVIEQNNRNRKLKFRSTEVPFRRMVSFNQ